MLPHHYSEFHPKWYRPRLSTYWWLKKGAYLRFILRELSSVFVFYWMAVMLAMIYSLSRGAGAYGQWLAWMKSPVVVVLNVIAFFFICFHAITWFNLAPKAMTVHLRGKPVPAWQIAGGNYAAWAVVSLIILLVLLWG